MLRVEISLEISLKIHLKEHFLLKKGKRGRFSRIGEKMGISQKKRNSSKKGEDCAPCCIDI